MLLPNSIGKTPHVSGELLMRDPDEKRPEARQSPAPGEEPTRDLQDDRTAKHETGPRRSDTPLPALDQRYEILGEAGRGGMGIVYRARDRETNEYVALKVLKPEIADDSAVIQRFKDELKLARKVTHKNVCRIHDFNRAADGSAYISMEYVDGDSLRRILGRFSSLSVRKGIQVAQQICAGLGEAHAQGVVHRDLKPENIMLDEAGNVKIMDFGIARSLDAGATQTGGMIGTPAYMSPEQAEGKKADHRADIYSLGLIFYEMFTGSTAFSGQTPVEIALKKIQETPAAPRTVEPTLPGHVEDAILKCLEKNPAKRFQSVEHLEAALTQQAEEKPAVTEGAEVTMPPHLAFWQHSDWYLFGFAVLGAALFFPLFYRFHPAPALKITTDAEEARQIASGALKKMGWEAEAEKPILFLYSPLYYDLASAEGSWASFNALQDTYKVIGGWYGSLKIKPGKYASGSYEVDTKGNLVRIYREFADSSHLKRPAASSPAELAQLKELERAALISLFGESAAVRGLEPPVIPSTPSFIGERPLGYGNFVVRYYSTFIAGDSIVLQQSRQHSSGWKPDLEGFWFAARSLLAAPLLVFFAMVLFTLRRLHRQPRSLANLCMAAAMGLGFVHLAATLLWTELTTTGERAFLCIVLLPLVFCVSLLLCYAVLNTVLYYLRSRFPEQAVSYLVLFREHVFARGAGLALLRGVFAGLGFSGLWMVVLSLAELRGHAFAGMIEVPFFFYGIGGARGAEAASRLFPDLVLCEGLVVGWLLVAFPLSLLGKASRNSQVLIIAVAALWLAFGFSLAGATLFPTLPYYLFIVVQAIVTGGLFLRYDLLTTLSGVFTIEICLLAFPMLEIMQHVDPIPYLVSIGLWAVLVLAAASLYFRPQLVASYRRVAAVFE
jgi:protein kinase-like protein